jgi:Ankyrin repeat
MYATYTLYRTPLHAACRFGHHDVVCALLKKGAMLDTRDGEYTTLQCIAVVNTTLYCCSACTAVAALSATLFSESQQLCYNHCCVTAHCSTARSGYCSVLTNTRDNTCFVHKHAIRPYKALNCHCTTDAALCACNASFNVPLLQVTIRHRYTGPAQLVALT